MDQFSQPDQTESFTDIKEYFLSPLVIDLVNFY